MKHQLYFGVALAALTFSGPFSGSAFAQSTGTIDAEEEIVVTASSATDGVRGVVIPDVPKTRTVLTQELIGRLGAGQSVLQVINLVPGVNFTNNDPYGSSGGNIRIRGFDGNRVSLTFDGVPLNDSGNYSIFSNQQLDPEIIEQVNVNQGTTDVDSPTASAAGGTVNYRTLMPTKEYGAYLQPSIGDFGYNRVFGILQTGEFTSFGTKMFVSASYSKNDKFKGAGSINKQQYNARLYQPIGGNGDFISISGHYNQNRNNNYRQLTLAEATADLADNNRFDRDFDPTCTRVAAFNGTAQSEAAVCTDYIGYNTNPSNTGNVRVNSRFTLTENLTLTVDPSFQYVLATGGAQSFILSETAPLLRGASATGRSLNADADTLDSIRVHTPSVTNTRRYGLLASLRWDITPEHYVRLAYAYDRANHRQTGNYAQLSATGDILTPFGGRDGVPILSADGLPLQQRDRLSIASLNQISGEYRGRFFDEKLTVVLGVRAPFFKRELNQYCYTVASSGNPLCIQQVTLGTAVSTTTNYVIPNTQLTGPFPTLAVYAPFRQTYNYNKVLPSAGFTFRAADNVTIAGNWSQGFSAPRTDNLYRSPLTIVTPETTNNFDLSLRYTSRMFQANLSGFLNKYKNRIQSSFDDQQQIFVDRSIGDVDVKGVEASVDVRPFPWFFFRGHVSYVDARLKGDIRQNATFLLPTTGKFLSEQPEIQYGYYAQFDYGPASLGLQYKHVGKRFATDLNDIVANSYNVFDLDARISLKQYGLGQTFIGLNIYNLFNERYLGSISSRTSAPTNAAGLVPSLATTAAIPGGANPTFFVGSPRTISATLRVGF